MHRYAPIDLRRLAIFLAVVDEGGFTAAGDALDVTQPSISQAIRELEAALGAALFFRIGRAVRLTPAGEALVLPARQAFATISRASSAVREVAGLSTGRLEIACLPTLAAAPLAPIIGAFCRAHPGVAITLTNAEHGAQLVSLVRAGRCELGLTEARAAEDLCVVPLGVQDLLVVLPPGSPVKHPYPLDELARQPLVAAPKGSSSRDLLDEALEARGVTPHFAVETAQREALLPLIACGAGAGLLPRPIARQAEALGCVVAEPRPGVSRSLAIVHRPGPLTPAAQRFVAIALERAEDDDRSTGLA